MHSKSGIVILYALSIWNIVNAQDLEPRAYVRTPVNLNVFLIGSSYSSGGVTTDPSIPLSDLHAKAGIPSLGFAHSFSLFGLTAQAAAFLPYGWLQAKASVNGQAMSANRTGFCDMRFRISALLFGAPAVTARDFGKQKPLTILGASLTVVAPTGEYYADKLINMGAGRWAFKPELAVSHPLSNRWLLDFYAGLWIYTINYSYYPGNSSRAQDPIGAFQAHASYNIKLNMWAAFDATYYTGGSSMINGQGKDDRLSNVRYGATMVLPTGKKSGLKFAVSDGAYVIKGTDFLTASIGWQFAWF